MLKKIFGANLLLIGAYAALISLGSSLQTRGFNIAIGVGACVFFQVLFNAILGIACFIMDKRETGRSFFITSAALLPIGFIAWLLLLSVYG